MERGLWAAVIMDRLPLLFADVDWVRLAIFMVVGVGYLISFIATRLRERQIAKNRPARPPRPNKDTAKELEEFLKKTTAGRRGQPAQKPAQAVSPPQARGDSRARPARRKADDREKRRRPAGSTPGAPMPSLVNLRESELTKDVVKAPLAAQVQPSIDTRKFTERASHLGSLEADHSLEAHLKQAFSHDVGTLAAASSDSLATQNRAAAAVAAATGTKQSLPIAALLRGGNLRNAVILNEIFQRPEDRW